MPDLDDLLDESYAAYARESARASDVDALLRQGAVRRRRSQVRVVGSAVLAAAVIVVLGVVGVDRGVDDDPEPAPSPTPPASVKLKDMTPEQIVQHPDATLYGFAVSGDDPGVRASVWHLCANDRCRRERTVVAVTQDGFETAKYAEFERYDAYAPIDWLADDTFYVQPRRRPFTLSADGTLSPIERTSQGGPVETGEYVSMAWYEPTAIDAGSGTSHPLSVPDGVTGVDDHSGDRLIALTRDQRARGPATAAVTWSYDGGATWSSHDLPRWANGFFTVIPSADQDTIALVEGIDGATVFPFIALHVSRDRGATWERIPALGGNGRTPEAFLDWAFVRADGALLTQVEWAGDPPRGQRDGGPLVSDGLHWSQLNPSDGGLPDAGAEVVHQLHSATDDTLYVSQGARAYVSTDGGSTWEETPAR